MNGINGGPWWLRAVTTIGPLTAMALGLVYWVTQVEGQAIQNHAAETSRELRILISISQQTCANTATTTADRAGCFVFLQR